MKSNHNLKSSTILFLMLIVALLLGASCAGKTSDNKKKKRQQNRQNNNAQQVKKPTEQPITNWNQAYTYMKSKPYQNFGVIRLERSTSGTETIQWQQYKLVLANGRVSYVLDAGERLNSGGHYRLINKLVEVMEQFRRQDPVLGN